ncbi:hypothetical protein [Kitasatospora sp. NPDC004531]
MRRRVIRTAAAGLLAAAATIGLVPTAQAADPVPTSKCVIPNDPWPGSTEMYAGQELRSGGSLLAKDNKSVLVMEADGNLVFYLVNSTGGPKHAIWSSGTSGHPGAYATMQKDGNFVVYQAGGSAETGGALWASNTTGQLGGYLVIYPGGTLSVHTNGGKGWSTYTFEEPSAFCPGVQGSVGTLVSGSWAQSASVWLVLQQDGNMVMYRKRDDKAIWSSGTWGNPGAMGRMQADGNLVLYKPAPQLVDAIWSTGTFWSPGAYALLQDDGNFVIYRSGGGPGTGGAIWSTGTYGQ